MRRVVPYESSMPVKGGTRQLLETSSWSDIDSEGLTVDSKYHVPRIVCNLESLVFIFKDVSRQHYFSCVNSRETGFMSAAHTEAVSVYFDRPPRIFSGFLIAELYPNGAEAINIELFEVRSNGTRGPTFRKNRKQVARHLAGVLFEEYPAGTVMDGR